MVVALEGLDNPINGCVILPGALRMEDEDVPVVWRGRNEQVLGRASKLERNGNEVTMEIQLNDDIFIDLDDHIGGYVYVQPFTGTAHPLRKGAISNVDYGRIREVVLQDLEPPKIFDPDTVDLDPRQEG